ncbi:urease accessory protein UreD [Bacillus tuaregi]|uniref:urease accessory protein UreD n=1 Tax=Bacillus tuaregi TaxID=1816695 RepID=UPI0008F83AE0|nr:urease accessory protein UreD [Bacillus tuaregi]
MTVHTGYLQVEVGNKNGKSVITNSFFDGVFKITRPTYGPDNLPLLTLIHVGGGYVDGDSYLTEVVVNDAASLALTTQASTKVYKSPRFGVTQTMDFFLKENSELHVKQDPLILYRDASFKQFTNVYMNSSALFTYCDIMTPGWSVDGQPFLYKKLASQMKIYVDSELKVFDHLLLEPDEQIQSLMNLEGFTHIGTMFVIHQTITEAFITDVRELLLTESTPSRWGISKLSVPGLVLRVLAFRTADIEKIFSRCEHYFRKTLQQKEGIEWRKC